MITFIDETCPRPYNTFDLSGCGGTEATITRIATGLSRSSTVAVEQRGREKPDGGIYLPIGTVEKSEHVVCLRNPPTLLKARKRFKKAKLYLWLHDWAGEYLIQAMDELIKEKATLICVSQTHKSQVQMTLAPFGDLSQLPIKVIYPPIDDALLVDATPVDKNKLTFISSPHKGLEHAIKLFQALRGFIPDARLYITNPGYYSLGNVSSGGDGIFVLGSVPHADVIRHLRESLCLFYPNYVFPETFGLVFAEANAVGTPVLTHGCGAAYEVLKDRRQIINARDAKETLDRVMRWHEADGSNRPSVSGDERFRLSNVVREWGALFQDDQRYS